MKTKSLVITKNIFDQELLDELIAVLPKDARKQRWTLSDIKTEPMALYTARDIVLSKIPVVKKINTSVLKRYDKDTKSGAYIIHRDPEEFQTQPLVLITLSGMAEMKVQTDVLEAFPVKSGDCVVLADPSIQHCVTPPIGNFGVRMFLFFGFSSVIDK